MYTNYIPKELKFHRSLYNYTVNLPQNENSHRITAIALFILDKD